MLLYREKVVTNTMPVKVVHTLSLFKLVSKHGAAMR